MSEKSPDVTFEEVLVGERLIGVICMQSQRSAINVFDEELGNTLVKTVHDVELWCRKPSNGRDPFAVVLCSGKPDVFMAGADIHLQLDMSERSVATKFSVRIREALLRIEALPVPTIAILNGTTLGGGLEIALACMYRVAGQDVGMLGLPEVKLGLLPGAGGCVRLPRLIGLYAALPLIISGSHISAKRGKELGLLDQLFTETNRVDGKYTWISELDRAFSNDQLTKVLHNRAKYPRHLLGLTYIEQRLIHWATLRKLDAQVKGRFPAPYAILDTVLRCWNAPLDHALLIEARSYVQLVLRCVDMVVNLTMLTAESQPRSKELHEPLPCIPFCKDAGDHIWSARRCSRRAHWYRRYCAGGRAHGWWNCSEYAVQRHGASPAGCY